MKKIFEVFVSVYHKTPEFFAIMKELAENGVIIKSSGGTADELTKKGFKVVTSEEITDYPSILGGRVKTLHPKILGPILARTENQKDQEDMKKYNFSVTGLVIVDLYPFAQTVEEAKSDSEIIEKIDIGGPTLIRSAAKNHNDVLVVGSQNQYKALLDLLKKNGCQSTLEERYEFAKYAFNTTCNYENNISAWFNGVPLSTLPKLEESAPVAV